MARMKFITVDIMMLLSLGLICSIGLVDCQLPSKVCYEPSGEGLIMKVIADAPILKGCTVYVGSIFIANYRMHTQADVNASIFFDLREITGSLVMGLVAGKYPTSLGFMFPNLRVIRGNQFFYGFTLLLYFDHQLLDMSLPSLTKIERGKVRIQNNKIMCYYNTIKWSSVMGSSYAPDRIITKTLPTNCPTCPAKCNGYCWNAQKCQIICDSCGESGCDSNGKCCHAECLGGCFGPQASNCYVCKHQNYNGTCMTGCPFGTYEVEGHCVRHCPAGSYRHKLSCIRSCPKGWIEFEATKECIVCDGCKRECDMKDNEGKNIVITSIDHRLQNLKRCTVLKGNLIIRITYGSGNIVKELEDALSNVEEIEGYLEISSTPSIVSLEFLKNLKIIHGNQLARTDEEGNGYAIVMLDNRNLENLWQPKIEDKLKVKRGKLFFHFNPRLCHNLIVRLAKEIGQENDTSPLDIPEQTNGDQIQCTILPINITTFQPVVRYSYRKISLKVEWVLIDTLLLGGSNKLVNYIVYYRPTTNLNVTVYDGVDACGVKVWQEIIVDAKENKTEIKNLKPNTIYAVYVKTLTISRVGAISDIKYYVSPDVQPTEIRNIEYINLSPSSFRISWDPPSSPNGLNLTYKILYQQRIEREILPTEVCTASGTVIPNLVIKPIVDATPTPPVAVNDSCPCLATAVPTLSQSEAKDIQSENQNFYEYLTQLFFYKKTAAPTTVSTANVTTPTPTAATTARPTTKATTMPTTIATTELTTVSMSRSTVQTTSTPKATPAPIIVKQIRDTYITLDNLKSFTKYSVTIIPCNSKCPSIRDDSAYDLYNIRTLPDAKRDQIENVSVVKVPNSYDVVMNWSTPVNPNGGHILAYEIRITRYEDEVRYLGGLKYDKMESRCVDAANYSEGIGHEIGLSRYGFYIFDVKATSLAGNSSWAGNISVEFINIEARAQVITVASIVSAAVFVILTAGGGIWYYLRRRFKQKHKEFIESINPDYMNAADVYIPDDWEFEREKIALLKELGKGAFGMVYLGEAADIIYGELKTKVAVKTVNEKASFRERQEFLNEACIMKQFDCNHVVRLLGIVSQGLPPLVIMELMANGDLKNHLRSLREDADSPDYYLKPNPNRPSDVQFHKMAAEIADGMLYLSDKKFVHRDLAARNCMVSGDFIVKIGDFGMTRDVYASDYYRKGGKGMLPVRWMPPESLRDGVFTSATDVWSYGVVLWEIATLSEQPYPGKSNEDVLKYVLDGGGLERPPYCSDKLYRLMVACTQFQPKLRPRFREIIALLLPDLPESFQEISYYHSEECAEAAMKDETRNAEKERAAALGLEIRDTANSANSINNERYDSLSGTTRSSSSISRKSTSESSNDQISSKNLILNKKVLNSQHGSGSIIQTITASRDSTILQRQEFGKNREVSKSTPCVVVTNNTLREREKPHTFGSTRNVRVSKL